MDEWGDVTGEARVPWYRVRVSRGRRVAGFIALVFAGAMLFTMYGLGLRFFVVSSISMERTFHASERIVSFPEEAYRRGDLVILRDPTVERGYIVKRVIGLAGDAVEIRGGAVLLNGTYASEPYRPEPIDYTLGRYVVPERSVFVLGDNANWSVDSHNWDGHIRETDAIVPGAVATETIVGKVRWRYWPPARLGRVRHYPLSEMIAG